MDVKVKIYFFFWVLLLFIGVWLVLFRPVEIDSSHIKNLPQLEFKGFVFTSLDSQGVQLAIKGKSAAKIDNMLMVENIEVERHKNHLQAQRGIYKNDVVKLLGNVKLSAPTMYLSTQKALYYLSTHLVSIETPFVLKTKEVVVHGKRLVYNEKSGTVRAYTIQAVIKSVQ